MNEEPSESYAPQNKSSLLKTFVLWKVGIIEFLIAIVSILILLIALNYFNILPISGLWPKYFGFLPHQKEISPTTSPQSNNQTSTPSTVPTVPLDTAKQTLTSYLPTILNPSLAPQASTNITIIPSKSTKDFLDASWVTKEGVAGSNFYTSSDSKNITSLYFQFEKIQPTSVSVELAKSNVSQVFTIQPQGEWGCKPWITSTRTFCENFWEEDGIRKGVGFLIIPTSSKARLIYTYCEHTRDEPITFEWKSCKEDFAKTGVL